MNAKKLGKNIRLARVEMDMSQVQLAKEIGMIQHTISHYEIGKTIPSLRILEKLSFALHKPFSYFLEGVMFNYGEEIPDKFQDTKNYINYLKRFFK